MKSFLRQPILPLAVLVAGVSVGCVAVDPSGDTRQQPLLSQLSPNRSQASAQENLNYVARVVQEVGPAVVRIDSSRSVRNSGRFGLEDFFNGRVPQSERIQRGTGSGFIITPDGQVITNAHVVEGADNVSVVLTDGRRLEGEVLGTDELTDIAVIKINTTGLPTVKIGNSDNLLPGQFAIAIGNPLGLDNTVTQGIISATGRSSSDVGVPDKRIEFIQTDAAINPGNSGGPLLNAEGEVIGVNTAIIQGAQGLGFAIPITTARRVAEQLATRGRVDHPYLGIQMAELSPELREQINNSNLDFKVNREDGVVIIRTVRRSPAAQAGLQPGDVIESINGKAIQTPTQVQQQVDATGVGNPLTIVVNRNGRSQSFTLKPAPLPNEQ